MAKRDCLPRSPFHFLNPTWVPGSLESPTLSSCTNLGSGPMLGTLAYLCCWEPLSSEHSMAVTPLISAALTTTHTTLVKATITFNSSCFPWPPPLPSGVSLLCHSAPAARALECVGGRKLTEWCTPSVGGLGLVLAHSKY